MAQHTIGPWRLHPTGAQVVGGPAGFHSVANVFTAHWRGSAERAQCEAEKAAFLQLADEHRANACLIIAAPDLLATLKAALPLADELACLWNKTEHYRLVQRIKAVIASAEGG